MSRKQVRPKVVAFFEGLSAVWQVVSAGTRTSIRLPPGGPYSDNAVVVVFEAAPQPLITVVPSGVEEVSRAGAMPIGPDAAQLLNALSATRERVSFGLRPVPFERGPIAVLRPGRIEQHARLERFDGKVLDPVRLLRPLDVVLHHLDALLDHCGIDFARGEDAIVVPTLGPVLGICPAAVGAIPRGSCDPASTYRVAKVPTGGWRIPIGTIEAGVVARVGAALRPGISTLRARYEENADLQKPFRINPRRPTTLAGVTQLPKCVVKWFLQIPPNGLKIEHRKVFAGFANATNRADEVFALACEVRPDLKKQLGEAKQWTRVTRTCGDILMRPSNYARLGLACDCAATRKRSATESDVFSSDSSSDDQKRGRLV
jgi:hypothetical protein